jgi:hypothetical protein
VARKKTYVHFTRHALEGEDICTECGDNVLPHKAFDEEGGTPVYPTMWDRENLMQKREDLEADPDSGLDTWYCQWGVIRRNPAGSRFKAEWFVRNPVPKSVRGMRGFVTGDSAWKDTSTPGTGDYSWFWEVAQDRSGVTWVLDAFRTRTMTAKEGADAIVSMMQDLRRRGCSSTLVYQKAGETTWPSDVMAECNRQRIPYVEIPITVAGKTKFDRGLRMAGPAERGQIVFTHGVTEPLFKVFIDEIIHAPRWPHDDGWDGLANVFDPKVRARVSGEKNVQPYVINPLIAEGEEHPTMPSRSRYCGAF